MVVVRLLLALSLLAIVASLVLYVLRRDRRYLTFVVQVVKFTLLLLLGVLLWFAAERLFLMPPSAGKPL